jgi:hypothetical protein
VTALVIWPLISQLFLQLLSLVLEYAAANDATVESTITGREAPLYLLRLELIAYLMLNHGGRRQQMTCNGVDKDYSV